MNLPRKEYLRSSDLINCELQDNGPTQIQRALSGNFHYAYSRSTEAEVARSLLER